MAKATKKWVSFKSNCKVPAGVLDKDKEVKVETGVPVQLPVAYAKHVIDDGFADACNAPKKPAKKKPADDPAQELAEAGAAVEAAQAVLDAADGDEAIAAATTLLSDAQAALADLENQQA